MKMKMEMNMKDGNEDDDADDYAVEYEKGISNLLDFSGMKGRAVEC